LAIGQGDLFGGVELPALVRQLAARRIGWSRGPGRRGQARLPKPAAQRRRVRQRLVGKHRRQLDPDQAGSPAGMRPPQRQRRRIDRFRQPGSRSAARRVVRRQAGVPAITVAAPDGARRPGRQAQVRGDGRQRLAGQMPLDDRLPQVDGKRAGHGGDSFRGQTSCSPLQA